MNRVWLFVAIIGITVSLLGAVSAQNDKKPEEKKKEETILGKTIGEWIKILRTHENPKYRRAALIALEGSNTAARAGLAAVLEAAEKDKEPQVRLDAVLLIGRLGPKEIRQGFKALLGALQADKSDAVREAAATAIGNKYKDDAGDYVIVLAEALKDPHAGTRIAVAGALRNMGENAKPAFPALFTAAKNPKEETLVRLAAVHLLSRYSKDDNNAQTLSLLLDLLKNADAPASLRESAIDGLGRSGSDSTEVVGALGSALADKNIELRKAAAVSLGNLGVKANSAWPAIKPRLSEKAEPEGGIRNHLIRLAGTLAKTQPEAIVQLTAVAKDDKSTENRIAAIQELAELGTLAKDAVPTLTSLAAQDSRATIREAASKAIQQISGT